MNIQKLQEMAKPRSEEAIKKAEERKAKREDQELLLKDLCGRLPYGVKVKTPYNNATLLGIIRRKSSIKGVDYIDGITDKQTYPIRYIQPYLRPLSSMTEEESIEYCDLQDKFLLSSQYPVTDGYALFDWLNKKMFDYRGLIPKGLAISTEKFNPYKE